MTIAEETPVTGVALARRPPAGTDPSGALLASLVEEAYALAQALDCARDQLPGPARVAGSAGGADRGAGAGEVLERLLRTAERDVAIVVPGGEDGWRWLRARGSLVRAAMARGCRARVLIGGGAGGDGADRDWVSGAADDIWAAGGQVRLGPALSQQVPGQPLLATELAVALFTAARSATVITQPYLVQTVRDLIGVAWAGALPHPGPAPAGPAPAGPARPGEEPGRDLRGRILQLLSEGAKDEVIARLLGISVRTCRRHIACLLTDLDAGSRFQAGVNAARAGLITGPGR